MATVTLFTPEGNQVSQMTSGATFTGGPADYLGNGKILVVQATNIRICQVDAKAFDLMRTVNAARNLFGVATIRNVTGSKDPSSICQSEHAYFLSQARA